MTAVPVGATVHDLVQVSGGAGNPVRTGTVTIDWFTNGTCTGTPASTSAALALTSGSIEATGFAQGPLATGLYGFQAHYLASRTYSCSRPITRVKYTNVATVIGTAPGGKKVTDKDSAVVKVAPLKPVKKPKPKPKPPVISHEKPKSTG